MFLSPLSHELKKEHEKIVLKIWNNWEKVTEKIYDEYKKLDDKEDQEDKIWEEKQFSLQLAYIKRQKAMNEETYRHFNEQEIWRNSK